MAEIRDTVGPNGFTGRGVIVYQMTVIASGLRLYTRTGMRPNRAYTPSAMVRTAKALLGVDAPKLGARDYLGWADALTAAARALAAEINASTSTAAAEGGR